jgi:prepilin-type N-terminal cleavage/methylation domain-containing protein
MKNYIEAEKARREEDGEKGFSLIELIVVVVILGILVAVAVPIFLNIQQSAKDNSLDAAASDGAVIVAAAIADADSDTPVATAVNAAITANNGSPDSESDLAVTAPTDLTAITLTNFCVSATAVAGGPLDGGVVQTAGPGCTAAPPAEEE